MQDVQVRSPGKGRTRWLSETEITALREHSADLWPLIATAIGTGMRRGELLAMRVRDLDLDRGAIIIPRGKSARARRTVPLGGEVLDLLRLLVESENLGEGDQVFATVAEKTLRPAWETARRAAGLGGVWFHDLRHTFATLLIQQGESLAYVKDQLGHHSIQITVDTYGHLVPGGNRQAVDKLDDVGTDRLPDIGESGSKMVAARMNRGADYV